MPRAHHLCFFAIIAFGVEVVARTHAADEQHTNRLIYEKSPYLLQHAHNPVDWYPWGGGGVRKSQARTQADLPLGRLLDLSLVSRDGARKL